MPFVTSSQQIDAEKIRPEKLKALKRNDLLFGVRVKWSELTEYDRKRKSKRLIAGLGVAVTAAVLANPNGAALFGAPGEDRSQQQIVDEGKRVLAGQLSRMDVKSLYETQYVTPIHAEVSHRAPGKGLLGYIASTLGGNALVQAGQDCLADSGYDTSPSSVYGFVQGSINSTPILGTENGNEYSVYPAAENAKPLRFVINAERNSLLPVAEDAWTVQTLSANGHCSVTGMQYSYASIDSVNPELFPVN